MNFIHDFADILRRIIDLDWKSGPLTTWVKKIHMYLGLLNFTILLVDEDHLSGDFLIAIGQPSSTAL